MLGAAKFPDTLPVPPQTRETDARAVSLVSCPEARLFSTAMVGQACTSSSNVLSADLNTCLLHRSLSSTTRKAIETTQVASAAETKPFSTRQRPPFRNEPIRRRQMSTWAPSVTVAILKRSRTSNAFAPQCGARFNKPKRTCPASKYANSHTSVSGAGQYCIQPGSADVALSVARGQFPCF